MKKVATRLAAMAVAVVVAAVISLVSAPPSAATINGKTWSNKYPVEGGVGLARGWGRASVTVDWISKRRLNIEGWVDDVCGPDHPNGDGFAVSVQVWTVDNSSYQSIHHQRVYRNALTCKKGKVYFDPRVWETAGGRSGHPIAGLGASLCLYQRTDDGGYRTTSCVKQSFDNPFTPPRS